MRGLVIPANPNQPTTVLDWDDDHELLPLLYGTIGCDTVELLPVPLDGADLSFWVDENGFYAAPIVQNPRATRMLANLGWRTQWNIVGTAVVTGGADGDGRTQGLSDELLGDLQAAITAMSVPA